jgi:leucyl aminopeptidase (aminopeptidase T)
MSRKLSASVALLAVVFGVCLAEEPSKPGSMPTTEQLAKNLVTKVARVKEGDVVLISGKATDASLLDSLNIECNKVGAEGLVTLNLSDAAYRRLFAEVPAKFDKRRPTMMEQLADLVTVTFSMENTDMTLNADLPPERVQARSEAGNTVSEKMLKRNVRQVFIGNGLYPADSRATELGITKDELAAMFQSGLAADSGSIAANGAKLKEKLEAGKQVRIICPNGTDLTLGVTKRQVSITDGVISDENLKTGGAACQVWLPAGEAYLVPVAGSGTGKVVIKQTIWEGKEINDLTIIFKNGKVEAMSAKPGPGFDRFQAAYKVAGLGKDELSVLDIGLNPNVKLPAKCKDGQFMAAGIVTVSIGGNIWAGGENKCPFGRPLFIRDATMSVDGIELVKVGVLDVK